jgi:uncharacterized protein YtpQ (UPF0354 family)
LEIAAAAYPSVQFEGPPDRPGVIVVKGVQIRLQNLRAKFEQSDGTQATLEELVEAHLELAFGRWGDAPDFGSASKKIRAQIMPRNFADEAPIASLPFGRTLAIGLVMDKAKAYRYLKLQEALDWKKSHQELLEMGIANLDQASQKMPMQSGETE